MSRDHANIARVTASGPAQSVDSDTVDRREREVSREREKSVERERERERSVDCREEEGREGERKVRR
jgi:hypothetical protein